MEAKDWAPWAGIGVSLLWNLANTVRGEVRSNRNTAFVEFKALKAPADTALAELRARKAALLSMQAYDGQDFVEKIRDINRDFAESFGNLTVALETLDGSTHSTSATWFETASARWDEFISAFDRIYAPKTVAERNQLISAAASRLVSMLDNTLSELEAEGKSKLRSDFGVLTLSNLRRQSKWLAIGMVSLAVGWWLDVIDLSSYVNIFSDQKPTTVVPPPSTAP